MIAPIENRAGLVESWINLVMRRWLPGAVVFLAVLAATVYVVFFTPPKYRADARIRLGEPPPASGVSPTTGFIGLLRMGGDPFANDVELIRSRSLAESVTEQAVLNARVIAARDWNRDSLFAKLSTTRATDAAQYRVEWLQNGSIAVAQVAPADSALGQVAPGVPFRFGGLEAEFRPWRAGMPRTVRIRTQPFDDAARSVAKRIRAERTKREANVLDLMFDDIDPGTARMVVDATVRGFIALRTSILRRESGETVDSLRAVAEHTRGELMTAERALESWQRETRLFAPDVQSEAFIGRYSEALVELETARMERAGMDSVLARLNSGRERPADAWTTLLAYPSFLANETLGLLLARMSTLKDQQAELRTRRAETSREMRVLTQQIAALDSSLRAMARGYGLTLHERIGDLEEQVKVLDQTLSATPSHVVEMGRRQRSARMLAEIVVLTEQRLRQEELRQALTFANIQIIDPPALQRRPVWPRKTVGIAVGLALALIFGALGMAAAEAADPSVRRGSELRAALGAPVLASIQRRSEARLSPEEAAAVLTRANGSAQLVLAPVGPVRVGEIAAALEKARATMPDAPRILTVAPVGDYASASVAAAGSVAVVVEAGRTRKHDLQRAIHLLHEAGADVAGVIVVCKRSGDARTIRE